MIAYREVTGKIANIRSYKNKEEFLAATENQNLPEDVKQEVCKAGFPLTVYTLKFQSKQHQNFQAEIQDLIKNRKLRYLGKAPTNTNSTQPSPTPMEQGTLTAKSSPSSFFEPIPIPTQILTRIEVNKAKKIPWLIILNLTVQIRLP